MKGIVKILKSVSSIFFYALYILLIYGCQYKDGAYVMDTSNDSNSTGLIANSEIKKVKDTNLKVRIETEDNFELSEINFRLSDKFPSAVSDYIVDLTFGVPLPSTLQLHPSIQTNIKYSDSLTFENGKSYSYNLKEGVYFASIENGRIDPGLRFAPMELGKVLLMFGYSYELKNKGKYMPRNIENTQSCNEVIFEEEFGQFSFSCPNIIIEKSKVTTIIIKIGKRKWNSFGHIFFFKFIPGILLLGPITNLGHYFHRDYNVEIQIQSISNQ